MSIFKNAKQITIPESISDTTKWLSDEEIIKTAFIFPADKVDKDNKAN